MIKTTTNSYPAPGAKLESHPYADLFPMMDPVDRDNVAESLETFGQREDIVLLDGKILDGRNRYEILVGLGIEPRFRMYDYTKDGQSPLRYVMDRNLSRRHLSTSQRATVAACAMPLFDEEEKARASKQGDETAPVGDEFTQPFPPDEEGKAPKPQAGRKGKPRAPKTADKAAAAFNVSTRSVERAAALQEADPVAFESVKKGETNLNAALAEVEEKKKHATEYDEAVQRIQNVCGPSLAAAIKEGTRMKKAKEVMAYAALTDDEMLRIRALIEEDWTVARALKYQIGGIARTHRISDLLHRAQAQGGVYNLDIEGFRITVQKLKEEDAPKPAPTGRRGRPSAADKAARATLESIGMPAGPEEAAA